MSVAALIAFSQAGGGPSDSAGRAVEGGVTAQVVTCTNGDNTNVGSWKWELLDKPRGSSLTLGTIGTSSTLTFTPDVGGGCYRIRLTVKDNSGTIIAVDVRNFGVPNANGVCLPPFQPQAGVDYTKEEMNFGGQVRSWTYLIEKSISNLISTLGTPPFIITGTADVEQLQVKASSPQTNKVSVVKNHSGANVFSVAASGLVAAVALQLTGLGVGVAHVDSSGNFTSSNVVNADVDAAAAIAYSKLALASSIVNSDVNASAAIAYSKLNLAGSIVNADVNASAAIAYSKLNLSASIVNADINASAAIAGTKISPDFGSQTVQTTGAMKSDTGFTTKSATTLAIGTSTTTAITIGASGIIVTVAGRLNTGLGIRSTQRTVTIASDTMTTSDDTVRLNRSNGVAETLPTSGNTAGDKYTIIEVAGSDLCTLIASSGTIFGEPSPYPISKNERVVVEWDGANWI